MNQRKSAKRNARKIRTGTRLLSLLLSVCLLTGLLPEMRVQAAKPKSSTDNPADWDIQMLDRLGGNGGTISVVNHSAKQIAFFEPMVRGAKTALIYTMPSNGPSQATIYKLEDIPELTYPKLRDSESFIPTEQEYQRLKQSDARMGYLVGFYSLKHCTVSPEGVVTAVEGKETIEAGKALLKEMSKQEEIYYGKLSRFPAIGMDGQGPSWYTLRQYYAAHTQIAPLQAYFTEEIKKAPSPP